MEEKLVFVSVGATATAEQESFVRSIEDRLRSESLIPKTVGRNTFSADAPLKAITELMEKCSGIVVIALERSYFPSGLDKRGGPRQGSLADVRLPTPWNHIEAAMAYTKHLPLLVIVEAGLKAEGLLEPGYDWYVQTVPLEATALASNEFNGVLADWKEKVLALKPGGDAPLRLVPGPSTRPSCRSPTWSAPSGRCSCGAWRSPWPVCWRGPSASARAWFPP